MAWMVRGAAALMLAGCAAPNPAYDLRDDASSGSAGGGTVADGGDGSAGVDGGGGSGDGGDGGDGSGGSDGGQPPAACDPMPKGLFDFGAPDLEQCGSLVDTTCTLVYDTDFGLMGCTGMVMGVATLPVLFGPEQPPSWAVGQQYRLRARWSTMGSGCHIQFAEVFAPGDALPIFAGSRIPEPDLMSITAATMEPDPTRRCACAESTADCCPSPPGPYSISFSTPAFGPNYFVKLEEGDVFDEQIGSLGHPYVDVFVAQRSGECNAPLRTDWVMVQR